MLFTSKRISPEHSCSSFKKSKTVLIQLNDVSQVTHPLNINKKYELFIRLEQNKFTGNGFRRVEFPTIVDECISLSDNARWTARKS